MAEPMPEFWEDALEVIGASPIAYLATSWGDQPSVRPVTPSYEGITPYIARFFATHARAAPAPPRSSPARAPTPTASAAPITTRARRHRQAAIFYAVTICIFLVWIWIISTVIITSYRVSTATNIRR